MTDSQDAQLARRTTYRAVSTELALLSDQHLLELLNKAEPMGVGIGGTTALLTVNGVDIFVKKIRLTDLERQPENSMSTRNIFELPLYYQYGIGSAGFGVWRELAAHTMTTNWVLAGECHNFPIMYHWRVLPKLTPEIPTTDQLAKLEQDVAWWGESSLVRARLMENLKASADVVVFLECFSGNLHTWLRRQMLEGGDVAELACAMVERKLKSVAAFMNARGLLHFDAHFNNILTDGHDLYFSDFGLATCAQFDLSKAESDFFKKNYRYDQCYTMAYFVEWLLTALFGAENWAIGNDNALLHEYAAGKGKPLLPVIDRIIRRYVSVAVVMNDFFLKLKESKATLLPTDKLEYACKNLSD